MAEVRKFDELFLLSIEEFDISKKEIIDNGDYVIILIHFFTFICNVCYSSDNLKKSLSQQFSKIIEKLYKFIEICDEFNMFHTNLFESIVSFLINISCELTFREKMKNETRFLKFLIHIIRNKIYDGCKIKDLLERGVSLLINLGFKDDLNQFFLDEGMAKFLINNIKFNELSIESLNNKEDKEVFLLRILMMITKLTKVEVYTFLNDKQFLEKLVVFSNTEFYLKNTIIHDNIIR